MKKLNFTRILLVFLMMLVMTLTACTDAKNDLDEPSNPDIEVNNKIPEKAFNEGIVLVKYDGEIDDNILSQLDLKSAERLFTGSSWFSLELRDSTKTVETVNYLRELKCFEEVDYDYVMGTTADASTADVSGNPDYKENGHHHVHKIPEGWEEVKKNGKHPGGSSDVVIAVIDTGVDYNHLDLRNNIWTNSAEIPGNGKDDDKNGYIDDVYGWDCVGNDNDPIDDNGHGTHVAGIIAAENNNIGGVGVAYNCKVMVLKAGNSSGYFNNSDIAEAVQYAYMNGASVINMSFGGSYISLAVEEALENAYNTCVLVAAAGNDAHCNSFSCRCSLGKSISYPAALPYVIGVMSTNNDGTNISSFSNQDHIPYDSIEYEVYAVGESVHSCWPNNKYAKLNGTSMAAPTVSGIAALLRSMYPDRNTYSTKYLQSQIVNTGTINPYCPILESNDSYHSVTNVYEALTRIPKPTVNLYDYSINDATSISEKNNGNGVIDAGETVRLSIALQNRGGVATNVNVSIDTQRSEGLTDPYFTFVNTSIHLSDIGTYSVRESGEETYFEIIVSDDCPNDYLVDFNIRFSYSNGLDEEDDTLYQDDETAQFNVSSGYHLPSVISEDTVFTNNRHYIVGENLLISKDVTVTFEEGCEIQFYDDREYYNSPQINVYGTLKFEGTPENMVKIYPSESNAKFACCFYFYSSGNIIFNYVDGVNIDIRGFYYIATGTISNSNLSSSHYSYCYEDGKSVNTHLDLKIGNIIDSYIDFSNWNGNLSSYTISNCIIKTYSLNYTSFTANNFSNNIVYSTVSPKKSSNCAFAIEDLAENNLFISSDDNDPKSLLNFDFDTYCIVNNNTFSEGYQKYANQCISGYLDAYGNPTVDVFGSISDSSLLYPHISNIEIFNADNEQITTIGKEEIKVRVTFSKPMDTSVAPGVFFGTIEPYADYKIEGEYVSDTVWEGTYSLKAYIENGLQKLVVKYACAADDCSKVVRGDIQLYEFNIDTTAAMSMNLFASATDSGIELTWAQDDYDTLMGYNIYRSTSKDGNYVKINPSVLLANESSFVDTNAEPGVTYWYTFTVVLSDFSESAPAGKVYCTALDTLNPSIYHTPVNQGYQNNNLVISCTVSDNIKIASVVLYYRTYGETEWKNITMSKVNDKYSATIFGSELTLEGLEYYIVASDGTNTISKGSEEAPYFVIIKDASSISRLGDVDGDGVITTKDALMIMQCINGDLIMTDDEFKRADLNKDDVLSSVEALRILQYINGNISSLDM